MQERTKINRELSNIADSMVEKTKGPAQPLSAKKILSLSLKIKKINDMKRTKTLVLFFASLAFLVSCSENVDTDSRYVFNKKTVMEYLSSHEEYSEYCELLKEMSDPSKMVNQSKRRIIQGNMTRLRIYAKGMKYNQIKQSPWEEWNGR